MYLKIFWHTLSHIKHAFKINLSLHMLT